MTPIVVIDLSLRFREKPETTFSLLLQEFFCLASSVSLFVTDVPEQQTVFLFSFFGIQAERIL